MTPGKAIQICLKLVFGDDGIAGAKSPSAVAFALRVRSRASCTMDSSGGTSRRAVLQPRCTFNGVSESAALRVGTTPVLESGQTVFMIARHSRPGQQSPAGLLRDSPVLSCARRVQRPSSP